MAKWDQVARQAALGAPRSFSMQPLPEPFGATQQAPPIRPRKYNIEQIRYRERNNLSEPRVFSRVEAPLGVGAPRLLQIDLRGGCRRSHEVGSSREHTGFAAV